MERPALLAELERRAAAFDPARSWVRPGGATLSDRVWQGGVAVRGQIDAVLREAIRTGEDALLTAEKLEAFLDPALAPRRDAAGKIVDGQGRGIVTKAPYPAKYKRLPKTSTRPLVGSFPARRLARTEITRAHGQATVDAAKLDPFVVGVKWNLSARHPRPDECDANADRDAFGLGRGIYPPGDVPRYPNHPMDICFLTKEPTEDVDAVVTALRQQYGLDLPRTPEEEAFRRDIAERLGGAVEEDVGDLTPPLPPPPPPPPRRRAFHYDADAFAAYRQEAYDAWAAGADDAEFAALYEYKQQAYRQINAKLRGIGTPRDPARIDRWIEDIDFALSRATIEQDAILHRGFTFPPTNVPAEWANVRAGDIIIDPAYLSTTTNAAVAESFTASAGAGDFALTIRAPAGSTRGLFLDPLDPSLPEDEILLPRSTQLLVKSVKRDKSGRVDVVVEVLPDG